MTKRIGRYEVISEIGRGGFGHVYRAFDPSFGRPVAIKVLTAAGEEGMLTRFRTEATLSGRLKHQNIITVYDFGDQDGVPYIVMELLEGSDLQHVIESRRRPPVLQQVQIMSQIAAGLRYAHASGVIHRDVKPANIMILADGNVKVMDFGIAIITQATHSRLTPRGAMIGTFRYMAPEQFRGVEANARSDIFAYGLIFYELLSGVHPFYAPEAAAQMYNILSVDPVPVGELCQGCPSELQAVVSRLLQKDPEVRYQTLDDVLFDIEPTLVKLRGARAGALLEEARSAKERNQLEMAQGLIRQALELAPGYEGAREFREQIQNELRRQAIRPKLDDLLRRGMEALAFGKPAEAVERFESAIKLDPFDTQIKALLQEARSKAQSLREANSLSSDAETALRAGDLSGAVRLAQEALKLVPVHTQAQRVLAESEAALVRERQRVRLADGLMRVRRLIHIRSWQEAADLLGDLRREFPEDAGIGALSAELRAGKEKEERERVLAAGLATARQQIQRTDLQGAIATLEQLSAQFPESAETENMLGFVRSEFETQNHRIFVENSLSQASAAASSRDFAGAVKIIEEALSRYPADQDLQREWRRFISEQREAARRQAVERAIAAAEHLRSMGRLPEALEPLDSFLQANGAETAVADLRNAIAKEQEAARRKAELQAFVYNANQLLEHGNLEQAETFLYDSPSHLRNDPLVTRLFGELKVRQQAVRRGALDDALLQTTKFVEGGFFDRAIELLNEFRDKYGEDPQAESARDQVRGAERKAERAVADLVANAAGLLSVDPAKATALLGAASEHVRKRPEVQELLRIAVQAEQQKRVSDAVNQLVAHAREKCAVGDFDAALTALASGLKKFPDHFLLLKAHQETTEARERREREREEEQRRKRQADLEELRALAESAVSATEIALVLGIRDRARDIVERHPLDGEIRPLGASLLAQVADIESAVKELANRNFANTLQICESWLIQHPQHVLFAKLRLEAEKRQRLAYVEHLQERIKSTRDLTVRLGLLEEGLNRYPDEEWISTELRSTKSALSVVESIAKEATQFEEAENWDHALEKWQSLAATYPGYPGIKERVQQVGAFRDRARSEAIAEWARQIEQKLAARDPKAAGELLQQALAAMPDAVVLQQLRRRIDDIRMKAENAGELLAKGRAASERGEYEDGRRLFRDAVGVDPQDPAFRKVVLDALVKAAQSAPWRQAQSFVGDIAALDPKHPVPAELEKAIAEGIRKEFVANCLTEGSGLRQAGDLRNALLAIERGLAKYPQDTDLIMTRDMVSRELEAQREGVAAELRGLQTRLEASTDLIDLRRIQTRALAIVAERKHDAELTRFADTVAKDAGTRFKQLKRAQLLQRLPALRKWIAAGVGIVAVSIALFIVVRLFQSHAGTPVNIISSVDGASVAVSDKICTTPNCQFTLPAGTYTLTARKAGYQPVTQTIAIASRQGSLDVPLLFKPLPEVLQVNTNFENGQVILDGAGVGDLRDGQFSLTDIGQGNHTIRIKGGEGVFEAEWQSTAGAPPKLLRPFVARDVQATVITHAGSTGGAIACNCESQNVNVDGVSAGRTDGTPGTATPLRGLQEGKREIEINGRTLLVDVLPNPAVNISLALNREIGTLLIETGEDNAKVYLNDKPLNQTALKGTLRLPLPIGSYRVRVAKDGFRSPPAQTAEVKKGVDLQLKFALISPPATLEIAGAMAGAQVKLDGRAIGAVGKDGKFIHDIPAGDHEIELAKSDYTSARFKWSFKPGTAMKPTPDQLALSPAVKPSTGLHPPVDSKVEADDWLEVAGSSDQAAIERFIRNHPTSAHNSELKNRLAQTLERAKTQEASKAEQSAWDSAANSNSKAALQDFLTRYGSSPHAQEARNRIADIDRKEAELENAKRIAEEAKIVADRKIADQKSVVQVLTALRSAIHERDLGKIREIWQDADAVSRKEEEFKQAKVSEMELRPAGQPEINGNTATVTCTRVHTYRSKIGGSAQVNETVVRVTLDRAGPTWAVRSITQLQ